MLSNAGSPHHNHAQQAPIKKSKQTQGGSVTAACLAHHTKVPWRPSDIVHRAKVPWRRNKPISRVPTCGTCFLQERLVETFLGGPHFSGSGAQVSTRIPFPCEVLTHEHLTHRGQAARRIQKPAAGAWASQLVPKTRQAVAILARVGQVHVQ